MKTNKAQVTAALGAVCIGASITAVGANFTDSFEGPLDASIWSVYELSGGAPPFVCPSSTRAHTGNSSLEYVSASAFNHLYVSHHWNVGPSRDYGLGTVSVWVYDTIAGQPWTYDGTEFSLSVGTSCSRVAILANHSGNFYGNRYHYMKGFDEYPTPTSIYRTQGWHLFSISVIPGSYTIAIDNIIVCNTNCDGAGGMSYVQLEIENQWEDCPPWSVQFDDFTFALSPDLDATTLTWGTANAGAGFQYTVISGPLATATTAKLFWANGPTTAKIIPSAPVIFTQNIPAGASRLSPVINVPAANFANPPANATHVLLVLDRDNLVQEPNESNNVLALAIPQCPVGPLTLQKFPDLGYNSGGLDPELVSRLSCFKGKVEALSGTISYVSGYRSKPYQAHLREIFEHANSLRLTPGINVISTAPLQFATTATTLRCQAGVAELNQEITNHWPNTFPPYVAKNSPHSSGRAADWCIGGLSQSQITQLATISDLYRPLANEPCHFTPVAPNADVVFKGNSPINLLVTDPVGRKIGFDPLSNTTVNDVGTNATYSGAGSTPQVIQISASSVVPGEYAVSGVGTGTGPYSIDVQIICQDESDIVIQKTLATGSTHAGQPLSPIPLIDCLNSTISLGCTIEGSNLRLHSPQWATNVVVECTTNLASATWTTMAQPISPTDGLLVTNLLSPATFFRLRCP